MIGSTFSGTKSRTCGLVGGKRDGSNPPAAAVLLLLLHPIRLVRSAPLGRMKRQNVW